MNDDEKLVGFTCGAMDLFHAGHVLMLKEAKQHCDRLIVGLQSNPSIDRSGKNKPIQSIEERRIQLEGCVYVDEIREYETESDLELMLNDYSSIYGDRLVRIIGDDWRGKEFTGHNLDIKTVFNSRSHSYSTSELRRRIVSREIISSAWGEPWPFDDWTIPEELFEKIVSILPFGSTILELGSGSSSDLLSRMYRVHSVESNPEWVGKYPASNYLHVPLKEIETPHPKSLIWYDPDILSQKLESIKYDLILVDGPTGDRSGFADHLHLFNLNVPIVFDDTQSEQHLTNFNTCKRLTKKDGETIGCAVNKRAVHWFDGKCYSILY